MGSTGSTAFEHSDGKSCIPTAWSGHVHWSAVERNAGITNRLGADPAHVRRHWWWSQRDDAHTRLRAVSVCGSSTEFYRRRLWSISCKWSWVKVCACTTSHYTAGPFSFCRLKVQLHSVELCCVPGLIKRGGFERHEVKQRQHQPTGARGRDSAETKWVNRRLCEIVAPIPYASCVLFFRSLAFCAGRHHVVIRVLD